MKFYSLETTSGLMNYEFAYCMSANYVDAYKPKTLSTLSWWKWGAVCPKCGISYEERIIPWKMRWCQGIEPVGDFGNSSICQEKVVEFMNQNDYYIHCVDVEFLVTDPKLKQDEVRFSTTPYTGPSMFGILPKYGVHLNEKKSNIIRESDCSVCGCVNYDMFQKGYPSDFLKDLVVDEEEWNGLKVFGFFEFGSFLSIGDNIFVSEEGRDLLIQQGFTNMRFDEVGRIEKSGHGKMQPYREKADYDFWKPEEYVEPPPAPKKTRKKDRSVRKT